MLYKIINTYADESDFILNLIDDHPYIGWYMLLRLGESDTTKATLTRRECIEIIRKDGSYARNIFSYVYKAVDITVGNIQEKADTSLICLFFVMRLRIIFDMIIRMTGID